MYKRQVNDNNEQLVTEQDLGSLISGDAPSHIITLYPLNGTALQVEDIIAFYIDNDGNNELRGKGKIFIRVDSPNCNIKLPVIAPRVVPKKDIINI